MDEKELKRLLEKELDALTPSMSEKVRKAPVLKTEEKREKKEERKSKGMERKKVQEESRRK